jgi:hypothetical protein
MLLLASCAVAYLVVVADILAVISALSSIVSAVFLDVSRGQILGRNWEKSLESFPPFYSH